MNASHNQFVHLKKGEDLLYAKYQLSHPGYF